jgi:hypothetical protein
MFRNHPLTTLWLHFDIDDALSSCSSDHRNIPSHTLTGANFTSCDSIAKDWTQLWQTAARRKWVSTASDWRNKMERSATGAYVWCQGPPQEQPLSHYRWPFWDSPSLTCNIIPNVNSCFLSSHWSLSSNHSSSAHSPVLLKQNNENKKHMLGFVKYPFFLDTLVQISCFVTTTSLLLLLQFLLPYHHGMLDNGGSVPQWTKPQKS